MLKFRAGHKDKYQLRQSNRLPGWWFVDCVVWNTVKEHVLQTIVLLKYTIAQIHDVMDIYQASRTYQHKPT